jgi:predicted DNA-binding transcriptional regulator AlpA
METIITTDDNLLSTEELARITGLAPISLQHMRAEKRGPVWLKLGKSVRYAPADVLAWFAANRAA